MSAGGGGVKLFAKLTAATCIFTGFYLNDIRNSSFQDSGDYPLILTGPQWKKFKNNFCEFSLIEPGHIIKLPTRDTFLYAKAL